MSEILPEGTQTRFQQAIHADNYMAWLALSSYYMSLSRLAFADKSIYMADDLLCLSNLAHQRALDLEPDESIEDEDSNEEADWYAELNRGYAQDRI